MTATGTGGPLTPENAPDPSTTPDAVAIEAQRLENEALGIDALRRVHAYCVYWSAVNRKSSEANSDQGLEALAFRGEATADAFDVVAQKVAFEISETTTRTAAARRSTMAAGVDRAADHAEHFVTPAGVPDVSARVHDGASVILDETLEEWLRRFADRIREGLA